MSTAAAPVQIGRVVLTVNDLPKVADFYQSVLGLTLLSGDGTTMSLGAGDRVLVELRADRHARRRSAREPGLFHTAFLLPSREALARWLRHAAQTRAPLQGASDHLVSEAIYLADPEGNGVEVYSDRPRNAWYHSDGSVKMATEALDLHALANSADGQWDEAPKDTVVGHVHLQVGDLALARAFYEDVIGLPVMADYPGAAFHGSGGYHHHIATNVWNSRGAGLRKYPATGLASVELLADSAEHAAIAARAVLSGMDGQGLTDPWGTQFTLTRKNH